MTNDQSELRFLVLKAAGRRPDNKFFYECLGRFVSVDVVEVNREDQTKLKRFLRKKGVDCKKYTGVVLDLFFRKIYKQSSFLNTLPNLYLIEEDVCQNFLEDSCWYGRFEEFYSKIEQFKLLLTNCRAVSYFYSKGVDCHYIQKGYDDSMIMDFFGDRDIEFGFAGHLNSTVYGKREKILNELSEKINLKILSANPGIEYASLLNRIKYFVSADAGFDEYMIKNYEALGAGCILCAFRQGGEVEELLGFIDMENVILYSSCEELLHKLDLVKRLGMDLTIQKAGKVLAKKRFGYSVLASKMKDFFYSPPKKNRMYKKGWVGFFKSK